MNKTTGSRQKAPLLLAHRSPSPLENILFSKGNGCTGLGWLGLTETAYSTLVWIIRRGAVTLSQATVRGQPEERWRRRKALDELFAAGYVYRDKDGWIRPAVQLGK